MSRIGNKPITIPAGVTLTIDGAKVTVKGPKGELAREVSSAMNLKLEDGILTVARPSDQKNHKSLHGLTRTLIANMVIGVTDGYSKNLEIEGVGYRAAKAGNAINLTLGFSHPVEIEAIEGIEFKVEGKTKIAIEGINKELVGQIAANIRAKRPPEPYKGKGVKYADEQIRRKEGKKG